MLVLLDALPALADSVMPLLAVCGATPARRREVGRALAEARGGDLYRRLWPRLELVSCWADGPSRAGAARLHGLLPQAELQPKGLLSTEAFVSLPLRPDCDPVLALNSHWLEFLEDGSDGIRLAHELEEGRVYSVIASTRGGLYRYATGDRVEVTGFVERTPTVRFAGRESVVSDLRGEKLAAAHVQRVLDACCGSAGLSPQFQLVAPAEPERGADGYAWFVAAGGAGVPALLLAASAIEQGLRQNFHYDLCRRLGQLAPLRLFLIDAAGEAESAYQREMLRRGMILGSIKLSPLDRQPGWERCFRGRFVSPQADDPVTLSCKPGGAVSA